MRIAIEQTQKHALSQRQMLSLRILEMRAGDLDAFLTERALESPFVLYERPSATFAPSLPVDAAAEQDRK